MQSIKVSGIYDKRTLKLSKELGVSHFGFDFRPLSLNFIQQYILEDLIILLDQSDQVFLHFQNEPDFMVNNILNSFKEKVVKPTLIFSDAKELEYYESFQTSYYITYNEDLNLSKVLAGDHCKGLVLDNETIKSLHSTNMLYKFSITLYNLISQIKGDEFILGLKADWAFDIIPSSLEVFDFDLIDVSVNDKVEVCYRNVDSQKFKKNLNIIKNLSC